MSTTLLFCRLLLSLLLRSVVHVHIHVHVHVHVHVDVHVHGLLNYFCGLLVCVWIYFTILWCLKLYHVCASVVLKLAVAVMVFWPKRRPRFSCVCKREVHSLVFLTVMVLFRTCTVYVHTYS